MWRMLAASLALAVVACVHHSGDTWIVQHRGFHDDSAAGETIAAMPDGGVALVWGGRTSVEEMVSRLDAQGSTLWSTPLADERCDKDPTFASRIAVTADGGVVVASATDVGKPICVLRFDPRGRIKWARQLEHIDGVTKLAVASDGVIIVAASTQYPSATNEIAVLSAAGELIAQFPMPMSTQGIAVSGDEVLVIGCVRNHGAQLVAVDRQGTWRWTRTLNSFPNCIAPLYLAVDGGGAIYRGWHDSGSFEVARLAADHSDAWKRSVAAKYEALVVGGEQGVVVGASQGDKWTIVAFSADGTPSPIRTMSSGGIHDFAATATSLFVTGWGHKLVQLAGQLELEGPCKTITVHSHGDPPRAEEEEVCSQFGWIARLAR